MNAVKERPQQWSRGKLHFENEAMDFYLSCFLGYCARNGAEYGECMRAASQIEDGDPRSWVVAWHKMARHVEALALATLAAGHLVSAREEYLRATTYYRAALAFIRPKEPEFLDMWEDMRSCFRMASALFDPPVWHVEVPFEGKALPGYFVRPDRERSQHPTVIIVGGSEIFAEELYFWGGGAGSERGYNALYVELPGQGSTPLNGLVFRPDAEVPLKAVVDYALGLPEVDPDRLYIYGVGEGGYMAARAAACDKRIKGCVLNAPVTDLYNIMNADLTNMAAAIKASTHKHPNNSNPSTRGFSLPVAEVLLDKLCWQSGVDTAPALLERMKSARLGDLVSEIECPTFCLVSDGGTSVQNEQAREFYNALSAPKQMRAFTSDEGAASYCEVTNLGLMQETLFDWLDELA